jgi:hypothetical protein
MRGMVDPARWLDVIAGLKALYDVAREGVGYAESLRRHRNEPATQEAAKRASDALSTYSDAEVDSILARIEGCRKRFIAQGGGEDRKTCMCSIFKEIAAGNGGTLPHVDDWENMSRRLNCRKRLIHL